MVMNLVVQLLKDVKNINGKDIHIGASRLSGMYLFIAGVIGFIVSGVAFPYRPFGEELTEEFYL